jgi:hypothetical protein
VEQGEPRFAVGWVRDVRAGRACLRNIGTPSEGALRWLDGPVGPIALDEELAGDEALGLESGSAGLTCADDRALLRALVERAGGGAVAPHAVIPTPAARAAPDLPLEARAASAPAGGLLRRIRRRLAGRP